MKRFCVILSAILLANLLMPASADDINAEPSLTISGIGRIVGSSIGQVSDDREVAIRVQLISELTQNSRCRIQTRWLGYHVAVEDSLERLTSIEHLKVPSEDIQCADYMVAMHYIEAMQGEAVTGSVFCVKLSAGTQNEALTRSFTAESPLDVPKKVAETVISMLQLAKRQPLPAQQTLNKPANLTWVVMPLVMLDQNSKPETGTRLATSIELAFQTNSIADRIVDRAQLNKVLAEHNIAAIENKSGGNLMAISKLAKADVLLLGQVAPWKKGLRLDIHVVDGRTGCVLAARAVNDIPPDQLEVKAVECAIDIAKSGIVPPKPSPSSAAQRRLEAETLLKREFEPYTVHGMTTFQMVRVIWTTFVSESEGAYLLVHDDPVFVYKNMKDLCDKLGEGSQGLWGSQYRKLLASPRAACLINEALSSIDHSPSTPAPILVRAEALMHIEKYNETISLVDEHLKRYPDIERGQALALKGFSLYKMGKTDEGRQLLRDAEKHRANSELAGKLIRDINRQALRSGLNDAKKQGDKAEYESYKNYFANAKTEKWELSSLDTKDLARFLELARKIEGPKNAMSLPDGATLAKVSDGHESEKFFVLLHQAYCCYELGQKDDAARKCNDIVVPARATLKLYNNNKNVAARVPLDEAESLLKKIESEIGPVTGSWKTAAEIRLFPENLKVYIIPVGELHKGISQGVAEKAGAFWGTRLEVLPSVSLPAPSAKKDPNSYQWDSKYFMQETVKKASVPENAAFVVFLTQEHVSPYLYAVYYNKYMANDVMLIGYSDEWRGGKSDDTEKTTHEIAWRIIAEMHCRYLPRDGIEWKRCENFPCIYSAGIRPWQGSCKWRLFSMCPACQEEYKKADFDKVHNDLMDYLKKSGAKIVKARGG